MARGDVLRIELPPVEAGREQIGRRPAIAVQSDASGVSLPTLMIIPLTSQLSALRFAYPLRIEPSALNGLTAPSVLLIFQLRAIDQRRILGTLGKLEQEYLDQLESEMKRLLGLR